MSDPRDASRKAIENRRLIQQLEENEARQRLALQTRIKQDLARKKATVISVKPTTSRTVPLSKTPVTLPTSITRQPELSPLGKISKTYENQFKKVSNLIDRGINAAKMRAATSKKAGQPVGAVVNFAISTGGSAVKGGFNAITFPVRPTQWKNTANAVSKLLTPVRGESQADYRKRVNDFTSGDIQDPVEAKRIADQILQMIPSPPGNITKEQREAAQKYREAVADAIADDPIAFIAETAGGLAGGYIASKILSKLPDAIKNITPKSLEQRAFNRLRPLESIDDVAGVESALGQNPAKLLPTGKWSKINSWVPKQRRGFTSIVVLVDPISKAIKGIITLKDAQQMTGGIPELLTVAGGFQAIPLIKLDQDITQEVRDELNRLNSTIQVLIPKNVQDQLDEDEKIFDSLINQGIIVIPQIDKTKPKEGTTQVPVQRPKQIQRQEQALEQLLVQEQALVEVPVTPPKFLKRKDREKRNILNLRLFRGAKSMYKVTFFFTKSMSEHIPVEARSFPEAVNKAQRRRKARKKQPRLVDVVKVK